MGTSPGWAGSKAEPVASEMRNGRLARTAAPLNAIISHLGLLSLYLQAELYYIAFNQVQRYIKIFCKVHEVDRADWQDNEQSLLAGFSYGRPLIPAGGPF